MVFQREMFAVLDAMTPGDTLHFFMPVHDSCDRNKMLRYIAQRPASNFFTTHKLIDNRSC
jgi:hypothetical protein